MEKLLEEQDDKKDPKKVVDDFVAMTNLLIPGGMTEVIKEAMIESLENMKDKEVTRVKPLSPKDIIDGLGDIIPGFLIEAVNNLLRKEYRGTSCTVKQKDIAMEAIRLAGLEGKEITSEQIYDNKWMDFEDIFRKAGWQISYDRPGYNESYDATFKFTPKGKNK